QASPAQGVEPFVSHLNEAFPSLRLSRTEVSLIHRALVAAAAHGDGSVRLEGHERVWEYREQGADRLVTIAGTKYMTARGVAERVTDLIVRRLERAAAPCRTAHTPLAGTLTPEGLTAVQATCGDRLAAESVVHLI